MLIVQASVPKYVERAGTQSPSAALRRASVNTSPAAIQAMADMVLL
jgi:hypothetical protein